MYPQITKHRGLIKILNASLLHVIHTIIIFLLFRRENVNDFFIIIINVIFYIVRQEGIWIKYTFILLSTKKNKKNWATTISVILYDQVAGTSRLSLFRFVLYYIFFVVPVVSVLGLFYLKIVLSFLFKGKLTWGVLLNESLLFFHVEKLQNEFFVWMPEVACMGMYSYIISTLIFGRLILVMSSDEDFDDAAYREYEDQLYHDESSSV